MHANSASPRPPSVDPGPPCAGLALCRPWGVRQQQALRCLMSPIAASSVLACTGHHRSWRVSCLMSCLHCCLHMEPAGCECAFSRPFLFPFLCLPPSALLPRSCGTSVRVPQAMPWLVYAFASFCNLSGCPPPPLPPPLVSPCSRRSTDTFRVSSYRYYCPNFRPISDRTPGQ